MKTELRKKVKRASNLIKANDMLTALINAMKKSDKQGLEINQYYLNNCIKRQAKIESELESMLN